VALSSFHSSPPTVGIELELQIVDAQSHALRDEVLAVLAAFPGDEHIKPEVLQSGIEVTTAPALNARLLGTQLHERLEAVSRRCAALGLRLCGGGVHPFTAGISAVTPTPRYLLAARVGGYLTTRLQCTYGQHVHVGMPSGDACMRVFGKLRSALSPLLALSASSALWEGHDTSFASFRNRLLGGARNYGVPPPLASIDDVERLFGTAHKAGLADSYRDMHWDLRPRPDYGTLEVRILDAAPTLTSALGLAAFIHALVVQLLEEPEVMDRWLPAPLPTWIEEENTFAAARFGLEAELIVDELGTTRPARETLLGLFEAVAPTAVALDCEEELAGALDLITQGTWAERQRRLLWELGSAEAVAVALADALDADLAARAAASVAGPRHGEDLTHDVR
jgi:glutamate---cysteine ligase / carboxylate-amine ligase